MKYEAPDGTVVIDEVERTHQWVNARESRRVEIFTNSVMTGDNLLAQAIIDMETGPSLLLTPDLQDAWVSSLKNGEFNPALVASDAWRDQVDDPQIFLYQTGRLDSTQLDGGSRD